VDIIFKGRRTEVPERFRRHATAKLSKIKKLDQKAIRVDVEVSAERTPRQSDRRERVELTIRSRGPVIRAEAAADDRYIALDRALAKLEERMRRTGDRRKAARRGPQQAGRPAGLGRIPGPRDAEDASRADTPPGESGPASSTGDSRPDRSGRNGTERGASNESGPGDASEARDDGWAGPGWAESGWADGEPGGERRPGQPEPAGVVPIQMEGDGPLVVREKHHRAAPMSVDQALLEMELVGHDFYLFRDEQCDLPSVVYRRHGYQYGLIRLMEQARAEVTASRGADR
jgi:ribosomal subunit interface protein